jgi:predicted deacylase
MVAKGQYDGPVVGIVCAIHGNELNGIPTIFRVFRQLDVSQMRGTLVAIPVLNPPGFDRHQRYISDGQDLNRLFPGNAHGNCGSQFVYAIRKKILCHFQYCIDLHTASFGRVNSLYVRCDMTNPVIKKMALLQNPQIIVHNSSPGGSLRGECMRAGVSCVTVEIGNPSAFQRSMQDRAFSGIENILSHLNVIDDIVDIPEHEPIICNSSHWLFSQHGGILEIRPKLCEWVRKGDTIAQIRNVFGDITNLFHAPCDGVIIGKNADPVCQSGDRLVHIGVVDSSQFAANVQDGH